MSASIRFACIVLASVAVAAACIGPVTPTPTGTAPAPVTPTSPATAAPRPTPSATPSATPSTTPADGDIQIVGTIFTVVRDGRPCSSLVLAEYASLSRVVISFRDETSAIHGAATTGELRFADVAAGCRLWAGYDATMPRLPKYTVAFDAPDPKPGPGGGYFDGVNQLTPVTMTLAELEERDFVCDFEAPQAFVVP